MTQISHTTPNLVSLVLASRGLAPTRAFVPEHTVGDTTTADDSLFATTGIVVRAFAIAALLLAAVASFNGERAAQADGPGEHAATQV